MRDRDWAAGRVLLAVAGLCVLLGCASGKQRDLYYWGSVVDANYLWLKANADEGDDVITAMEKTLRTATAKGRKLPPGFHAHLGLLYLEANQIDLAVHHWEAEKAAFPESIPFMDFQLNSLRGTGVRSQEAKTNTSETVQ